MRPLVWSTGWAVLVAVVPIGWLAAIELGTSRRRSGDTSVSHDMVDELSGRWFDLAAGLGLALAIAASLMLNGLTVTPRMVPLMVGVALTYAAIALSSVARHHLGRFHEHVLTTHPDHELVDTGPYRVVRHPIYTATVIAFVGIGTVLGNWISVLVLAALPSAALVHRIRVEEQLLQKRLGDRYLDYCTGRSRLIPGVW